MTRTEIIQHLIDMYGLRSYLEIGTQFKRNNFDKIRCDYKLSVDPDPNSDADVHVTSDRFFELLDVNGTIEKKNDKFVFPIGHEFGIFFIDGLHEYWQVLRDILNALDHLEENGFIVVHDCNPTSELVQRVPRESKQWTGDVWKAIVRLREREDLQIFTVDTDWGCAVIRRGENDHPFKVADVDLTYDNLDESRKSLLNLISVDTFKFIHKNSYGQEY